MNIETRRWNASWRVGRLRLRFCLMRHRYAMCSDRWVFQPSVIYDRAESSSAACRDGEEVL